MLGHKAGLDIDATRERLPRLATLPFDPTYKLMATFNSATDADRPAGRPVLRQGRGARGHGPRGHGALRRGEPSRGTPTSSSARTRTWSAWRARASG